MELNFTDPSELYRRFRERVTNLIQERGVSEAVCAELRNWGQFYEFPVVASWTRRLLRDGPNIRDFSHAAILLECFGIAFRGDMVGHIGRDLLVGPLHSENNTFRSSAINVLVRWLEYDEDGMWLDVAEDHLEREQDPKLHTYLQSSVLEIVEGLDEEEEDEDPLFEEFLEVRRGCAVEMKGTAPILKIKPLICQLTGLTPPVLGSIIEYIQMPLKNLFGDDIDISRVMDDLQYTHPATNHLGVIWSQVSGGRHLRVWDTNGSFAFSVEPTASCDNPDPTKHRWLFFCHLR